MGMLRSRTFHTVLGFSVSIGLIVYLSWSIDWSQVMVEMRRAAWWPVLPITVIWLVQLVVRAWRWRYLLRGGERFTLAQRFDASMIGNLANFILPLRAGEFIRPWALIRGSSTSYPVAFVSIVLERFFDLAAVLLSFGVMLLYVPELPPVAYAGAKALGVVAAAILVFIVATVFFEGAVLRVVSYTVGMFRAYPIAAKIERFVIDFVGAAAVLRHGGNFLAVLSLTVLVWFTTVLAFTMWLWMVNLPTDWTLGVALTIIVALAVAAPSSPGFVGVYQGGCIVAFQLLNYSHEVGMAYAILSHVHQYLFVVALGLWSLARMNLSFRQLKQVQPEAVIGD